MLYSWWWCVTVWVSIGKHYIQSSSGGELQEANWTQLKPIFLTVIFFRWTITQTHNFNSLEQNLELRTGWKRLTFSSWIATEPHLLLKDVVELELVTGDSERQFRCKCMPKQKLYPHQEGVLYILVKKHNSVRSSCNLSWLNFPGNFIKKILCTP